MTVATQLASFGDGDDDTEKVRFRKLRRAREGCDPELGEARGRRRRPGRAHLSSMAVLPLPIWVMRMFWLTSAGWARHGTLWCC
jgi:hypothetical protein